MSRTYTQRRHQAAANIDANDYNEEVRAALAELNGGLDQHNLPLDSVDYLKLAGMQSYTEGTTTGRVGPCNGYYQTEQADSDGVSWDLTNDDWEAGWNTFASKMSANGGDTLTLTDAREGMIKGSLNCAIAYRAIEKSGTLGSGRWGADYWCEVAVFANDMLLNRTGELKCASHIVDLPFGVAVGSGPLVIEARWRAHNYRQYGATSSTADWASILYVHGSRLWVRNQYR